MARLARIRNDFRQTFYHSFNRISGMPSDFPFGDIEKEKMCSLIEDLSDFFTCKVISFVAMSNHWHCIFATEIEPPDRNEVTRAYIKRYGKEAYNEIMESPDEVQAEFFHKEARRMRDFSEFIKDFQQAFTNWFNRSRVDKHGEPVRRRGSLWQERFKSILLGDRRAVWQCTQYVELNPVRAKLVNSPKEYRFCTWGRFAGNNKHPFQQNIERLLKPVLGYFDSRETAGLTILETLQRVLTRKSTRQSDSSEGIELTVLERVRYWIDGGIISVETELLQDACRIYGQERGSKRRFKKLLSHDFRDLKLLSLRCLRAIT